MKRLGINFILSERKENNDGGISRVLIAVNVNCEEAKKSKLVFLYSLIELKRCYLDKN